MLFKNIFPYLYADIFCFCCTNILKHPWIHQTAPRMVRVWIDVYWIIDGPVLHQSTARGPRIPHRATKRQCKSPIPDVRGDGPILQRTGHEWSSSTISHRFAPSMVSSRPWLSASEGHNFQSLIGWLAVAVCRRIFSTSCRFSVDDLASYYTEEEAASCQRLRNERHWPRAM